ncbi:MAG: hypothetical protein IIC73_07890 [Armatimonadetes bacterium]|nr:hypothetical protein [Armatimonadota bacterium]
MRLASLAVLVALAMCLSGGCSGGAGCGEMVELTSGDTQLLEGRPQVAEDLPDAEPEDSEPEEPADSGPQPPIGLALKFTAGQSAVYTLTNEITTTIRYEDGTVEATDSFLNATQSVTVESTDRETGVVTIETTNVSAGVPGKEEPDEFMRKIAASIEGSRLRGLFDGQGRGTELYLLGDGVGLNPMGPQAGSQDVMVGFMGMLLPGKVVAPGETWSGVYDISESAVDVFKGLGAYVESGTMLITYSLIDYDEERNLAAIAVRSEGRPVIKIPVNGAVINLEMKVVTDGRALVRLDDGWLEELKIESITTIEGYVASRTVVRSTTRRLKS